MKPDRESDETWALPPSISAAERPSVRSQEAHRDRWTLPTWAALSPKVMAGVAGSVALCAALFISFTGGDGPTSDLGNLGTEQNLPERGPLASGMKTAQQESPEATPVQEPKRSKETYILRKRETLSALLGRAKIPSRQAYSLITALEDVTNLRKLRPGQRIELSYTLDDENKPNGLHALYLRDQFDSQAVAVRTEDGYKGKRNPIATEPHYEIAEGVIEDSLYLAAGRAGAPQDVIAGVIRLMNYTVDFQRDVRPGDKFRIYYDRPYAPAYGEVGQGRVLFAELKLWRGTFEATLYEDSQGHTDYYDKEGQSLRKSLMITPLDGARLSSGFGRRKHPILGYTRLHKGLDFAAPRGTPIMAAGDGIVERANRFGGYGNYIRIRHGNGFKTAYAHLKGFKKGLKAGSRVKQGETIGYLGSTGRSTGPHLHYEIMKNGSQVNPLKLKLPTARHLKGPEFDRFTAVVENIQLDMNRLAGRDGNRPTAAAGITDE